MPPFNECGQLVWTSRLTLIVSGAAGLLGAGAVFTGLLGGAGAAYIMGMISGIALFVAITGRLTTIRSQRWANAGTPPTDIHVRRNRVMIRRRDVMSLIMFILCAAGTIVVVLSNAGTPSVLAIALAIIAPMTVFFALTTFASRTIVTADELIVETLFIRRAIPRHAVRELRRTDTGAVGIAATGQPREILMPTGVNSLFIRSSWDYRPAEVQALSRLRAALEAVPPGPGGGDRVVVHRRFATLVLAVLAAGAFVADVVVVLLVTRGTS